MTTGRPTDRYSAYFVGEDERFEKHGLMSASPTSAHERTAATSSAREEITRY
jgi:hypothetical protein